MPIDPVIRAEMTNLVVRAKKLEKELDEIKDDLPVWDKRVDLAREKGRPQLAEQAAEKAEQLRARRDEIQRELDAIDQEKDMLRYQAKRPSGVEVARAEMMLEEVRMGGLVDPDKAEMERELDELVEFDFGEGEDS